MLGPQASENVSYSSATAHNHWELKPDSLGTTIADQMQVVAGAEVVGRVSWLGLGENVRAVQGFQGSTRRVTALR